MSDREGAELVPRPVVPVTERRAERVHELEYVVGPDSPREAPDAFGTEPGPDQAMPDAPRPRSRALGVFALVLSVLGAASTVAAVTFATGGDHDRANTFAVTAIGVTAASFVVGLAALVLGRGRRWGLAGAGLAVIANPVVLLTVFTALGD